MPTSGRGHWLYVSENILFAASHFAAAKLGLQWSTIEDNVSVLWLPSGVAVAVLMWRGIRLWPGIALAALLVVVSTGAPVDFALAATLGNLLEPVTAVLLLRAVGFDRAMERVRDVIALVLVSALLSTMISATIGVAGVCMSGMAPWSAYGSIWWTWWLGNAMGVLVIGPLLLTWARRPRFCVSPVRVIEAAMLVAVMLMVSQLVFGGWRLVNATEYSLEYMVFPPLIWAAVRFGPRAATLATAFLVAVAIWGTVHGHGPFCRSSVNDSLLLMWFFMGVVAVQTLLLAAALAERKHAEQAMRSARDQARAAEADAKARRAYLANMSHEIRTPIHGMLGMTGLLLDTELLPEQREYADILRRSGDALVTLINDALDLSKLEAGKLEMEHIDFDLIEVIEGVVELLSQQAQSKGVELVCVIQHDVPGRVRGDPTRLRQVITNLVGNAVKFTAAGEVVVRMELAGELPDEWFVRVAVRDTGPGIAMAAQQRLFQAFSQADATTARCFGGTGLGLAICKELVELMRGTLGFESRPGEGSHFWFTVPVAQPRVRCEHAAVTGLSGARVLCAVANAAVAEGLEQHLMALGMDAEWAADGDEALCRLCGGGYALAIIEPGMRVAGSADPGVDRIADPGAELPELPELPELIDIIGADARFASLPLVGLFALGEHERGEHDRGMAAFLTRPVRRAQLCERLQALVGARACARDVGPRESARVLLVEDNRINQRVATLVLRKHGCEVDVVCNGREAVTACAGHAYDLVLMDCEMPEMDGVAATLAIRAGEGEARRVPIVGMSGHAEREHEQRCLAAGMNEYVIKPLKPDTLAAVLARWVANVPGAPRAC